MSGLWLGLADRFSLVALQLLSQAPLGTYRADRLLLERSSESRAWHGLSGVRLSPALVLAGLMVTWVPTEELRHTRSLASFSLFEIGPVHMHSCMCMFLGEDAHV